MLFAPAGDLGRFLRPRGVWALIKAAGLAGRVLFTSISEEKLYGSAREVLDLIFDIGPRVRSYGTDHLRALGPAIFACNHVGIFDPIYIIHEIYLATEGRRRCAQVMRDDYFKLRWITWRMARYCNTVPFPRGGLTRSRLDRALQGIRGHLSGGLILFISGTRSRSGEIMYTFNRRRKGQSKSARRPPGRILERLLRSLGTELDVVPTTLTYDLSTRRVQIVFGQPLHFGEDENPQDVRRKVASVIASIENQVYIGPQHLLPSLLYHPALMNRDACLSLASVKACLQQVSEGISRAYAYVQDGLKEDFAGSFERALEWYRRKGVIRVHGERLRVVNPPDDLLRNRGQKLKDVLPALYYWNQVKHIGPLRSALNEAAASMGWIPYGASSGSQAPPPTSGR